MELQNLLNKDYAASISQRSIGNRSQRNINYPSKNDPKMSTQKIIEKKNIGLLNAANYNNQNNSSKKNPYVISKSNLAKDHSEISKIDECDNLSENSVGLDTYTSPMKLNRPMIKLAYFIVKTWNNQLSEIEEFPEYVNLKSSIFNPYNVIFFQNKLLRQYEDRLDDELLQVIFPKYAFGVGIKEGQGFGEVSLFETCNRNANVYTYKLEKKTIFRSKNY